MKNSGSRQWKAFLLMVVFTTNFSAICHCAGDRLKDAGTSLHSCCGGKQTRCGGEASSPGGHKEVGKTGMKNHMPCEEKGGCPGTQAVKFNLLEKQVSGPVIAGPLFAIEVDCPHINLTPGLPDVNEREFFVTSWLYKHSPPDFQSLYQCFLI